MNNLSNLPEQFILYKFPNEENFNFEELSPATINDYSFHLQSFDRTKNLLFKSLKHINIQPEDFNTAIFQHISKDLKDSVSNIFTKEAYIEKCNQFIEATKSNQFEKLVLSRIFKNLNQPDLGKKFFRLTKKYPSALVYLLKLKDEIWIGATPELLLEIKENKLKTMALAGTRSLQGNDDWPHKEKHEHQVVVDYISKALKNLNPKIEETRTLTLSNLQHLMTPIHADWDDQYNLLEIINQLHPTPAVCGIPKEKAFKYILENENYDRSFYTGVIGWKSDNFTRYFVNLRCARITPTGMDVFVGGGITAGSIAENEWEETNLKAQALLNS